MKGKEEYYAYKPSKGWCIRELVKVGLLCALVAVLLYDRVIVAIFLVPFGVVLWKNDRKVYKRKVQDRLRGEFKEFIILLSGSLNAGYSLEQAIKKSYKDMSCAEEFSLMPKELALIINGLNLNRNLDELLEDMGDRCQEERIKEFARLVSTAKAFGGNINTLIDKTKKNLNDKLMVEKEIETLVAAKKLEGYIMLVMPFAIIAYMRVTNGEYISLLYETVVGNVVVTISLVMVLVCGMIIKKIMEIEV